MSDAETFYITHDPLDGSLIDPPPPPVRVTAKQIITEVAQEHNVQPHDLTGPSRKPIFTAPRKVAMKRIRDELNYSFPRIGLIFNRDHSTVVWAVRGGRPNQPSRNPQQSEERAA